jgi:hypothetical protein
MVNTEANKDLTRPVFVCLNQGATSSFSSRDEISSLKADQHPVLQDIHNPSGPKGVPVSNRIELKDCVLSMKRTLRRRANLQCFRFNQGL